MINLLVLGGVMVVVGLSGFLAWIELPQRFKPLDRAMYAVLIIIYLSSAINLGFGCYLIMEYLKY